MRRAFLVVSAAVVSAVLLVGCGDDSPSQSAPQTTAVAEHNDADIAFAQQMIPHHQQAVEMAALASTRAEGPQVKELAVAIESAQQPEIDLMTGWLAEWGAPASPSDDGMGHGDMGHSDGMMSEQDLAELESAAAAEFDAMFLAMMIEHHESAIAMAKTERAEGQNLDALALAAKIEAAQSAEIDTMKSLQ